MSETSLRPAEIDFNRTWTRECYPLFEKLLADDYVINWKENGIQGLDIYRFPRLKYNSLSSYH